jgi:hypothetical protein
MDDAVVCVVGMQQRSHAHYAAHFTAVLSSINV